MTFHPTGAIIAAPTMSLPEKIGGPRNWDYRYTWVRDAAFTVYAFIRVGFTDEARHYIEFLEQRFRQLGEDASLQVLYGVDGRTELPETILDHLEGYKGSSPVRAGNDAARQFQLDIVGDMIDAVYLYNKYCEPASHGLWMVLRRLADWVCDKWREPDEGIWEVRGGRQQFTFSKLMCWVALDRALKLAAQRSFPANVPRWTAERDEIYSTIMDRGFSRKKNSFVQRLDGDVLDASMLLAPLVNFVAPADPRMLGTLDAVQRELESDHLVRRYDPRVAPDGLAGDEGTFSTCTFWLAEALARAGRLDEARLTFDKMLGYANHVGLYSEEIDLTGEALGNFPQALTHLALISAAVNISRALDARPPGMPAPSSRDGDWRPCGGDPGTGVALSERRARRRVPSGGKRNEEDAHPGWFSDRGDRRTLARLSEAGNHHHNHRDLDHERGSFGFGHSAADDRNDDHDLDGRCDAHGRPVSHGSRPSTRRPRPSRGAVRAPATGRVPLGQLPLR
jgi:GH15 family glucan-1,4-alpha-glucosidase